MTHPSLESWRNAEGDGAGNPGEFDELEELLEWDDVSQARGNVVLLTGVERLALDSVAFSLADSCPSAYSICYDVSADDAAESGIALVRTVRRPASFGDLMDGDCVSFPMEDCCLSCAIKHDLAKTMKGLGTVDCVFAVLPIGVEGTAIAQYLADGVALGELPWDYVDATVADAVRLEGFEARNFDDQPLVLAGHDEDDAVRCRPGLSVRHRIFWCFPVWTIPGRCMPPRWPIRPRTEHTSCWLRSPARAPSFIPTRIAPICTRCSGRTIPVPKRAYSASEGDSWAGWSNMLGKLTGC